MKKITLFLFVFSILFSVNAQKKWVSFTDNGSRTPDVRILEENSSRVVYDISVYGMFVSEIEKDGKNYQRLQLIENQTTEDVGMPELPMLNQLIGIPGNKNINFNILETKSIV